MTTMNYIIKEINCFYGDSGVVIVNYNWKIKILSKKGGFEIIL